MATTEQPTLRRLNCFWHTHAFPVAVALGLAMVLAVSAWEKLSSGGEANLYAHQAESFLSGRLSVEADLQDVAVHRGERFVPFPPFPAVALMPLVAIFGVERAPVVAFAVALSGLSGYLLARILQTLELSPLIGVVATMGFFLGTAYWSAVRVSERVWFFAQVIAVLCTLTALHQALVRRSAWMSGLCLGLAFLSRQMTVYLALFVLSLLITRQPSRTTREQLRVAAAFAIPLSLCVGIYLLLNYLRFGDAFETGYRFIQLTGHLAERVSKHGLFSLEYVPFNAIYLFLQGFHLEFAPPDFLRPVGLDPFGSSLLAASPFVAAAFWARWHRLLVVSAWASVGLIVAQTLLYYNNGMLQWNAQRFTLDFLPALMVLVGVGMRSHTSVWVLAVAYAVALNAVALLAFQR
ncbi:MAG: glycosyl transferase family 39 [Anaerolineae bacterium]|nr:hypothetical protein [Thermoflexales bacterium]MDW8395580.1 glycosyl transferase family 39 [Anaerolineae bacterium]